MFNRISESSGTGGAGAGVEEPGVTTMDAPILGAPSGAPAADDTTSAVRKTRLSGTLILLLVVCVAATTLFAMRKIGLATRFKMPDITIDYPIEKADLSVITKDHERMIEQLRSSEELVQVPLEQVQMNPFALRIPGNSSQPTAAATGPTAAEREAARLAAERQKRLAELQGKVKSLTLNSVMGSGSVPVARVSGQLVRVGDLIQELFIVARIEGRSVTLMADGQEFVLTLGEP